MTPAPALRAHLAVDVGDGLLRVRKARERGKREALDAAVGAARKGELPHKAGAGLESGADEGLGRLRYRQYEQYISWGSTPRKQQPPLLAPVWTLRHRVHV